MSEREARYSAIGLDAKLVATTAKSKKGAKALDATLDIAAKYGLTQCEKPIGVCLYDTAMKFPNDEFLLGAKHYLVEAIAQGRVKSSTQVAEAIKYFKGLKSTFKDNPEHAVNAAEFDKAAGVGIELSQAEVEKLVKEFVAENSALLKSERYRAVGRLAGALSKHPLLKFADGKTNKAVFDQEVLALIGPKTDADNQKPAKKKTKKAKEVKDTRKAEEIKEEVEADLAAGREIPAAVNTPEQEQRRLAAVGDKIITRFPPEPNGFLHVGHCKAMGFNFKQARKTNGECILRFDDTNPTAEKQVYIDKIIECVHWLGHRPARITYSSDYFHELYRLAVKLIETGNAFVCFQSKDEIDKSREARKPSPYRNRPIEESLKLFEDMRKGKFAEGECTLRMKQDYLSPNPNMWDLVAYRIKYAAHPHVGDEWCIYPSYDFTHCIVDSLEWISHSLCTLEFEVRRESYFWLLDVLDLYKPKVWEYSRLNLEHVVMSKRKLKALVDEDFVSGWDDPRMPTILGLRRKGYTPEALNKFVDLVGVTRSNNLISLSQLEYCARTELDPISERKFVVLNPIRVVLSNYPADKVEVMQAPVFPQKKEDKSVRSLPLTRVLYIDAADFKDQDEAGYFGLAPGKAVYLKYSYSITCDEVRRDAAGNVVELVCSYDPKSRDKRNKKIKGHLHWVAEPKPGVKPTQCEVRLLEELFAIADPGKEEDWRQALNPNSCVTCHGFAEPSLASAKPEDHFQFERLGYFCADIDSNASRLVFNRTTTLRDSRDKK